MHLAHKDHGSANRVIKDRHFFHHQIEEKAPEFIPRRIADVASIVMPRTEPISRRTDIQRIVELPLRKACESLYDKNIITLSSSASSSDVSPSGNGYAYIVLSWGRLSPENQEIAQALAGWSTGVFSYDGDSAIELRFPMTLDTSVDELEKESYEICNTFIPQPAQFDTWTLADFQVSLSPAVDEKFMVWEMGFVLDAKEGLFYRSLEQWKKMHPDENYDRVHLRYRGK